jgi:integrin beta 3
VPPAPRPSPGSPASAPGRPGPGRPTPDSATSDLDWLEGRLDTAGPDERHDTARPNGRADTARPNRNPTDADRPDLDRTGPARPAPGPPGRGRPDPDGRDLDGRERTAPGPYPGSDGRPVPGRGDHEGPAALAVDVDADRPPAPSPRRPAGQARVRPPADVIAAGPAVTGAGLAGPIAAGAGLAGPTAAGPISPAGPSASGLDASGLAGVTTADPELDGDRDPSVEIRIDPLFSGTREIRTGRRADLRRQQGEVRRLRTATVILLVLAVLGAPLAFYTLREAARDPVFGDLAALEVPGWAARDVRDEATGSRWCIGQCRLRQRIMRSERSPKDTAAVYTEALRKAGWVTWPVEGCHSEDENGLESCWQRDEYVLDLWIYQPECEVQLKVPDPAPSGAAASEVEAVCPPTVVTLKIINRVGYQDKAGGKG